MNVTEADLETNFPASPGKTICHDKARLCALRKAFDLPYQVRKQVNHTCAKRPESGRFVYSSDHLTCSGRDGDILPLHSSTYLRA